MFKILFNQIKDEIFSFNFYWMKFCKTQPDIYHNMQYKKLSYYISLYSHSCHSS